jgi:hypothetical protein
MKADGRPAHGVRRGFVIGELLVAALLLVVAVSSLATLMYSVSRRPVAHADTECSVSSAASGKCVREQPAAPNPAKLLRSGCATRSVFDRRPCNDTVAADDTSGDAVVKARTDPAALAILARKQKAERAAARSDLGFVR